MISVDGFRPDYLELTQASDLKKVLKRTTCSRLSLQAPSPTIIPWRQAFTQRITALSTSGSMIELMANLM